MQEIELLVKKRLKGIVADLDPDPYGPVFIRVADSGAVLKTDPVIQTIQILLKF
jgi:hypothetical protein